MELSARALVDVDSFCLFVCLKVHEFGLRVDSVGEVRVHEMRDSFPVGRVALIYIYIYISQSVSQSFLFYYMYASDDYMNN